MMHEISIKISNRARECEEKYLTRRGGGRSILTLFLRWSTRLRMCANVTCICSCAKYVRWPRDDVFFFVKPATFFFARLFFLLSEMRMRSTPAHLWEKFWEPLMTFLFRVTMWLRESKVSYFLRTLCSFSFCIV